NNTYGSLGSNTGRFSAGGQETPTSFAVETIYNDKRYVARYYIKPRQVRLVGRVATEGRPQQGVDGVVLDFYALIPDGSQNPPELYVGSVKTAHDGSFRASIPSGTVRFAVKNNSIPSNYFHSILVPGPGGDYLRFDTEDPSCKPPVPANLPEVGLRDVSSRPYLLTPKPNDDAPKPDPDPCYY
ncbi:MAG TPA: hypothetical protein VGE01_01035, partial [Fimbriimonas sp.]